MLFPHQLLAMLLSFLPGSTGQESTLAPLRHAELVARLDALVASRLTIAEMLVLGTSGEGRTIQGLRIGFQEPEPGRPAILLVANIEGPELFASSVALDHAEKLVAGYGQDEAITELLDTTTVYVIPRVNVDAAEARFASPLYERRTIGHGHDDDRDGRDGEAPVGDVDGDGRVTSMRVEDPAGKWMEAPDDPRVSIEANAARGQRGRWKIYPEGRDTDGDELVAEDLPHDTLLNASFPSGWREHTGGSGRFPLEEPEARALADFVLRNRDVALVVVYDALDNLVEKPKSVKDDAPDQDRVPPEGVLESDAKLLEELGKRYKEATENETKGAGSDAGSFQRWCYDHRGLPTLSIVLWRMPTEAPAPAAESPEESPEASPEASTEESPAESPAESTGERKPKSGGKGKEETPADVGRMAWIDATGEDWRFVPWTPFEHPELGAVEIGGFAPYALVEPPAAERAPIAQRHLDFFLTLGDMLPRVAIASFEAEPLGADVWRVVGALENRALLPLATKSALRARTLRPARVILELPESAQLLAGSSRELVSDLAGSGGRRELVWLVRTADPTALKLLVDTDSAGAAEARAEVKQ